MHTHTALSLVAGLLTIATVKRILAGIGFLVVACVVVSLIAYPVAKISGVMEEEGL